MPTRSLWAGAALAAMFAGLLPGQARQEAKVDRGKAYYHYSMGHLYAELAGAYGNRGEYLNQAIDHYREAMKADPTARFMAEQLSDLYMQAGRIKEAITDAEAALRDNPNDLNQRRILGRIYMRLLGDSQQNRINEQMLNKALDQYTKIAEKEPSDVDAWLTLGRLQKVAQNSTESEKAFKKAMELDPENDDAITGLATVYADLGDARRAAELLKKVADKNPNLRTLMALAGSYEQMRDHALAAETLKKALELARGNEELKRALAQNLLMADKFDEAEKVYEQLVAEDPKDVQSLLRLSQIARQKRKFDKAREYSDQAKKVEPNNLDILYNEVGILEAEGRTADAVNALKTVVDATERKSYSASERANRARLLEQLGLMYRNNDQHKEAIDVFRQLGNLDSSFAARSAAQVVDTLRQARDFTKGIEESDAAAKKWPEDKTLRAVRSNLLADMGKTDQAAAELRKLLDGKNDRDVHLQLVNVYEKGKNYGEMSKSIDAAEKLSTSNEEKETIHFLRGAMFEKQKKLDQAEAEFRKLLAINPTSASALNYLGYMWADRNVRLNEAVEMIKKALEQEPNSGAYLDSLGWAYYRQGKLPEAAEQLQRALERTPKDPTIHDHLGDVYAKQGNLKDAITQWEASLKLYQSGAPAEHDPAEMSKVQKKLEGARVRFSKEQNAAPKNKQ